MAEILSLVANIIQVVQAGLEVYERLDQYGSTVGGLPEAFVHISARMGVLADALKKTQIAINCGALDDSSTKALRPSLRQCLAQSEKLKTILEKCVLSPGTSRARRTWKALTSFRYGGQLERIDAEIQKYVSLLTHHASTATYVRVEDRPKPKPCSTVPYRLDPHFIARESITSKVETVLQKPAARVALVGLGGVGKSQLAVHHSYRIRESSPDTWVFWVHAGKPESFEQGFEEIAKRAHIYAYDATDPERLQVVSNWLSDEQNQWVMILDNADDLSVLLPEEKPLEKKTGKDAGVSSKPMQNLLALLPQTPNGSYIVTSRNKEAASRIILGEHQNIINVKQMDEDDALLLLRNKLVTTPEDQEAVDLVKALEHMPLAISQAAAFINKRSPRWSIPRFLEEFHKGNTDQAELLGEDFYDARRDDQDRRSNSILRTWEITFQYLRKTSPSTARLLALMSLFHRAKIPESFLVGHYAPRIQNSRMSRWMKRRAPIRSTVDDEYQFEQDWTVLEDLSLIKTEIDGVHFAMHRLVQVATTQWLQTTGELYYWQETFVALMKDNYPYPDVDNLDYCITVAPHAGAAIACYPLQGSALNDWAYLARKYSKQSELLGDKDLSLKLNRVSFYAFRETLGKKHSETLLSAHLTAKAFYRAGSYKEAEALHRQVLEMRLRTLGPEDPATITSMKGLGNALIKQGNREEGDRFLNAALEIKEKCAEPDEVVIEMTGHVLSLYSQNKHGDAEPIVRRLAEVIRNRNGERSEEYLEALDRLGSNLQAQQKYRQAERIHRQVLESREQAITKGPEKGEGVLSNSQSYLAGALAGQGKFHQAELLYKKVLRGRPENYGAWTDEALDELLNLIKTLRCQDKLQEAESYGLKLIRARQAKLGDDHVYTLWVIRDFADTLRRQGRDEEAMDLYRLTYTKFKEKYKDHPDMPEFENAYGSQCQRMGIPKQEIPVSKETKLIFDTERYTFSKQGERSTASNGSTTLNVCSY